MASLPLSILSLTTAINTAPTSSSTSASPAPTFLFQPVNEMFTCGITNVLWAYAGSPAPLSLNISNINVVQAPPLSISVSIGAPSTTTIPIIHTGRALPIRRQFSGYGGSYLPSINQLVASQLDPSAGKWSWSAVDVPQGWYQMLANVQGVLQTGSAPFFVQNGTNTDCILQFPASSSASSSPVATPTTSASQSAIVTVSTGHSHAGAIAGGVIGGIAALAAVLCAFLFWFFRRRPRNGAENGHDGRWSAMALRKSHHASDMTSTQKSQTLDAEQTFIGSDEELSTLGHEKAIASNPPAMPPYQPSNPQSKRTSVQTNASYGRAMSNPEPPVRPLSHTPFPMDVVPLERAQTAGGGGGPRRKPAPRYDGAGETGAERNGPSSSRSTLDSTYGNVNGNGNGNTGGTHVLQHQTSFGAMRPMHVLIPDPPPPTRK
ncbi:hypothetical protein B0F90DRAFT_1221120 [Multifurca ochricompacta]|uniref:Uncharacterized protein n=1 Tax=Multifurca ochricompacta TaxID=376703 RepID=A0AAD4LXZ9_9AGAM|nr:hypothetical protein B0F90DRAFT_1221120 [Multifurca ochricompacta]